jgi:hypothetical protein
MQSPFWERIQQLFLEAADLPLKAQARFLDSACAGDPDLRAEVESLVAADRKNGAGVAAAVGSEAALFFDLESSETSDWQELAGQRLGPYRLRARARRGGMGAVYLATRDDDQ